MDGAAKELNVDRSVYLVDENRRTYRYLRRNHRWRELDAEENERNKWHLDGYTRIFPDGRTNAFRYRPPYTTRVRPSIEQREARTRRRR